MTGFKPWTSGVGSNCSTNRLFVQYSDIYDNENLPNSFKSQLKILPNTK